MPISVRPRSRRSACPRHLQVRASPLAQVNRFRYTWATEPVTVGGQRSRTCVNGETDGRHQPESREIIASLLQEKPGKQPSGHGTARPPSGIPSIEDLISLNQAIHDDASQPERHSLVERSALQSVIDRATDDYGPSDDDKVRTASVLAHGIAAAQAFRDGNRRTAYWSVRRFLTANDLGHLSGDDDHMLARRLNQIVERQSTMRSGAPDLQSFQTLFTRRLAERTRPNQPVDASEILLGGSRLPTRFSRAAVSRMTAGTCGRPRKRDGQPCERHGSCPYHEPSGDK